MVVGTTLAIGQKIFDESPKIRQFHQYFPCKIFTACYKITVVKDKVVIVDFYPYTKTYTKPVEVRDSLSAGQ